MKHIKEKYWIVGYLKTFRCSTRSQPKMYIYTPEAWCIDIRSFLFAVKPAEENTQVKYIRSCYK